MFTKFRLTSIFIALSGLLPLTSFAENGVIHLENGIDLTPSLVLGYQHNDNLLHAQDTELDSPQTRITTALLAELKSGRTEYTLDYEGNWGQYNDSSTDNYDNHFVMFSVDTVASESNELGGKILYNRFHEQRGKGVSQGLGTFLSEPLELESRGGEITWKYILSPERVWVDVSVNYLATDYKTAIALTEGKDRDNLTSQLTFSWMTGTESSLFLQGRHSKIDYDDDHLAGPGRDGDDYRALVGVRWQRGELGAGSFSVGYQNKQFDNPFREDFNGLSWELGLEWNPLDRLALQIESSRASVEPPLDGDYIRQILHDVGVSYDFSELIALQLNYHYLDQQYFGIARDEDTNSYSAELSYEFRSNIVLVLSAGREDKSSSLDGFSYEQNLIGLEVRLGLK